MKKAIIGLLTIIYFLLLAQTVTAQNNFCNESLVDHLGQKIEREDLIKGTTIFMITSYTCPPCVNSIPKYDLLREKNPEVFVVGILDNDSLYIESFRAKYKKEFWFPKVVDTELLLAKKYWKTKTWPEYHIYSNGELIKILSSANERTYKKMFKLLDDLEERK